VIVNSKVGDYVHEALNRGVPEPSVVGILRARGWPEKDVYAAIAAHHEQTIGLSLPPRTGSETPAKDAFFYLLIFSTLATWTIGLGELAFDLIDRWLADTLFATPYSQGYEVYNTAAAMASVLVAFPIYLLVSRSVLRDERSHPEKLGSPVRKWLTYMALVIAAGILIGDLITSLTYFLRGEITSRFLAKALVVLIISSGVFFYYFGGLRKSDASDIEPSPRRDAWMAGISGAVVLGMVLAGFFSIGLPRTQRSLRADRRRIQDLYQLSLKINGLWNSDGHQLPGHLADVSDVPMVDPISRVAYEYHVAEPGRYQLCATFVLNSGKNEAGSGSTMWSHPAGHYCFSLDAANSPDNPYMYTPD